MISMRLLWSNIDPLACCTQGQFQATVKWGRRYGRVFGYFEGYTPVLSVSDPDILREILVKDANNFNHRKQFPLAPRKSLGLFLENGSQWHRSRSLLTPAFSAGKLKQVTMTTTITKFHCFLFAQKIHLRTHLDFVETWNVTHMRSNNIWENWQQQHQQQKNQNKTKETTDRQTDRLSEREMGSWEGGVKWGNI